MLSAQKNNAEVISNRFCSFMLRSFSGILTYLTFTG